MEDIDLDALATDLSFGLLLMGRNVIGVLPKSFGGGQIFKLAQCF